MAEIEMIKSISFGYSGVFSLKDVYNLVHKWSKLHRIPVYEKEQIEKETQDSQDTLINFEGKREEDDYFATKFKVKVICKDLKTTKRKNELVYKGNVTINIKAVLIKDYDDVWSSNFFSNFIRAIWDKYIQDNKINLYHKQGTNELYELKDDLTTLFNIQHYKK